MVVSLASAKAATITVDQTVSTTFAGPLSFTLSLFNPAVGTLTGVTIDFSSVLSGDFLAQNLSASGGTLTGTMSGQFSLDGPAPLAVPLLVLNPVDNFGPIPVPAGDPIMFSVVGAENTASHTTNAAPDLAAFIGVGNLALNGAATASSTLSGNFNPFLYSADLTGEATVRITYEYDDGQVPNVPEPMTLYLMGGGLLALSFIRPRTSKKRS